MPHHSLFCDFAWKIAKELRRMSKGRYLSKDEYSRFEKMKADLKEGRLLNSKELLLIAESVDNDPTRLGQILLKKIEKFKEEDLDIQNLSDERPVSEPYMECKEDDDLLPYIEYTNA